MTKMFTFWFWLFQQVFCFWNTSIGYQTGELRLIGDHQLSGRIEVYYNGTWGSVCDDGWGLNDANVVCRQLGFKGGNVAARESFFGVGEGPIHFDDVACSGNEGLLIDCPRVKGRSNCKHTEDAGVVCLMSGDGHDEDIRLVGGNSTAGRVEIHIKGEWGTVCDDFWDIADATVICRQLGFSYALAALGGAFFGEGEGHVHVDDVHCYGNETSLTTCSISLIDNCDHSEDAGVSCAPFQIYSNYSTNAITVSEREPCNSTGAVRLLNGNATAGQISICMDGRWGTICDDHWDLKDAEVVCKQIGFKNVYSIPHQQFLHKLEGHKHITDINCFGYEPDLLSCNNSRQGICEYDGDASVSCETEMRGHIRLVGGNKTAGRVEIFLRLEWGTVCDDDWDLGDANVVCTQLGFKEAVSAPKSAAFGMGQGPIHISAVDCSGNESLLIECKHKEDPDCKHYEDSSVVCISNDVDSITVLADKEHQNLKTFLLTVSMTVTVAVFLLGCFAAFIHPVHKHRYSYTFNQELQLGRQQRPLPNVPFGQIEEEDTSNLSKRASNVLEHELEECKSSTELQKPSKESSSIYMTIDESHTDDNKDTYVPIDGVTEYSERLYTQV